MYKLKQERSLHVESTYKHTQLKQERSLHVESTYKHTQRGKWKPKNKEKTEHVELQN